ncbi:YhgE/Pip domain-containing protein [Leucobacter triazinivorans]|uniref:YhgE/Pip domain-containing protein n=1 Tax=Leucobacter triazinivorans TaxID=1784719 RepID=A0A4P6KH83_9MICO|nr:YhgE/Pip domain-containing protein [Leucobacter triazinivorans]QBE49358.1 YhgE/Pip domain-containing protein [Leucobacter triazinivorans]
MSLFTRSTELARFRRGTMPKIALAVLLVIPLIYGALYLWAFWAPTDNMDKLPVAIVNLDAPAETPEGDTLAAGDEVVEQLEVRRELDWRQLDAAEAARSVADGEVYFSVTIPRDFSSTLAGLQEDPKAGEIAVVYNDNNSFLASTLGKQAMVQLRDAVGETATRTAADQVLVGIERLSDGTRDAAEAAGTLDAGASAVADGSSALSTGLGELADGTSRLVAQAPELTSGTSRLADGLDEARSGSARLAEGSGALAAGAGEAATKSGELRDGLGLLDDGAARVSNGTATVADGTRGVADGAAGLGTGAGELAAGMSTLSEGLGHLADGAAATSAGAADLSAGSETLGDGAAQVSAGIASIAQMAAAHPEMTLAQLDAALQAQGTSIQGVSDGAAEVSSGASTLRDGAATLADGAATLESSTRTASESAAQLVDGADRIAGALGDLSSSAEELATGASQVSAGAGMLHEQTGSAHAGSGRLAEGAASLSAGARSVADGSGTLAGGVATAADGADRLAAGAGDLVAGAARLDDGAQRASEKSGELAAGAGEVSDGAGAFAERLAEGADEAPAFAPGQRVGIAETLAAPVQLAETTENGVQGFGEGFAPFFIALASFVGALITWLILRPLPRRPLASNASGLRSVLTGFRPAALIGVGQVVIMMLVLVFGIGMRPAHWMGMAAFMLLVTLAFLALQQMFIVLLGTATGRVVSLVLLMLMLSSSGGTYPVETTPGFFQALHPFMPASYVVDGLRQLIGGGLDGRFWISLAVMLAVLLGSLAISAVAARRQKVWTIPRLHPELAI